MVEAVINREKWSSSPKSSLPGSWGKHAGHYLSGSSDIAKSERNDNTIWDKPALADGFISELNRLYEFRGGLVLEDFLRESLQENPGLGGLLLDAYEVIRRREHFGRGTRLALEVVADPEAQGDRQLFVLIRTKLPPKVARAILTEIDQNWWLDALPEAAGKMEIALA